MDEAVIHDHLDGLLKLRRHCQRENAPGEAVQRFLNAALLFVRDVMTEEVFSRAMRHGNDGEGLLLLANRVGQLKPLLGDGWPDDFSYPDLVVELFGIANGDAPRMLLPPGRQGRFPNAHALLEKKLDAHVWYKVLGHLGMKTADRKALVEDAYGAPPETYNDWRKEARKKLTPDYVDRYLVTAVGAQQFSATMHPDPLGWAVRRARAAGQSYRDELRSTSSAHRGA